MRLKGIEKKYNIGAALYAKLEYFNPCGSVKDRVAFGMICDCEKSGKLTEGGAIIEPTSGNTGIGIAMVAKAKGYRAIIVMPDTMSVERQKLIKAYGAEVVLTDGKLGMKGAIEKANELHSKISGSCVLGQFDNPVNPLTHYNTTAVEIYNELGDSIDAFVAGVGTGGTITGVGKFLKEKNKNVKVVAVEPTTSAVLSGDNPGKHGIQGIGAGFVPKTLDTSVIDEIIKASDDDAILCAKDAAKEEGVFVGISSGAALYGAITFAKRNKSCKTIVTVFPDSGDRYYSTKLFGE